MEGYSWFMAFQNFMIMFSAIMLLHYLYVVILEAKVRPDRINRELLTCLLYLLSRHMTERKGFRIVAFKL